MARDYLGIPATSAPVERRFSSGADLVTPNRASLTENSIQTVLEMKEYLKFGGDDLKLFLLTHMSEIQNVNLE